MAVVNNISRLLDSRKIAYTAYELPVEKHGAVETARLLDLPPEIIYKKLWSRASRENRSWLSFQALGKLI